MTQDSQAPAGGTNAPSVEGIAASERYVFLDTEFTSLARPALLSIGMVNELGSSFYGEVNLSSAPAAVTRRIGSFARAEVVSQFGRVPNASAEVEVLARRLADWLRGLGETVLCIAYDYAADYDLLEELLATGDLPALPSLKPTHVAYLLEDADGEQAAARSYQESARLGLGRHHALADALALRARFVAVHG